MSGGGQTGPASSPAHTRGLRAGIVGDEEEVGQNSLEQWLELDPAEAQNSTQSALIAGLQLLGEIRDVSITPGRDRGDVVGLT